MSPALANAMLVIASSLPEAPLLVAREEALEAVREQEELDGCRGPACSRILGRLRARGAPPPSERVYAIVGDSLVEVARGGIEVRDPALLAAAGHPGFRGFFHTHPHSIAVPTPEDIAGAYQRRSLVECVGTRAWGRATVMCITVEHPGDWGGLAEEWLALAEVVHEYTDYYVPVEAGDYVFFIPSPTPGNALLIENEALAITHAAGADALILEKNGCPPPRGVLKEP